VVALIDASPLVREMADALAADRRNVLNGIARLDDDTFLLGGKRWPTTFRVRLVEA
jgi:glutamine cyclotransferase